MATKIIADNSPEPTVASTRMLYEHLAGRRPLAASAEGAAALMGEVVGPFSPISGPYSIEFHGSRIALERTHGVDLSSIGDERSCVYEATDTQGRTWFVRRGDSGLQAFRERVAGELVVHRDEIAELEGHFVPSFRLSYARIIALELTWMAEQLNPDRCGARASRREFKKRMAALSRLQWELLSGVRSGTPSASHAHSRMHAFGL